MRLILAAAVILTTLGAASAEKAPSCASIRNICYKRAPGHAAICDDLYSQAIRTGTWPRTEDPTEGKVYPAFACSGKS